MGRRSRRALLRAVFLATSSLLGSCTGGAIARKISDIRGFGRLDSGFDMMTGALVGLIVGATIGAAFGFRMRSHTLIKGIFWTTLGFVGVLGFLILSGQPQPEYRQREPDPMDYLKPSEPTKPVVPESWRPKNTPTGE